MYSDINVSYFVYLNFHFGYPKKCVIYTDIQNKFCLSNAMHSSIGQNIKSSAVSIVQCPTSRSSHVDNND